MTIQETDSKQQRRVLIIFFSFSSQTKNLIQALGQGIESEGISVSQERLRPLEPLRFPIGGFFNTVGMMLATFFRRRTAIKKIDEQCFEEHDLLILAGPTWSYNPSGPVLSLFDRDGKRLFAGRKVITLISCRGYWRLHWYGLKHLLKKCNAVLVNRIVFPHTSPEPWRTIGVFLKLAGRTPERTWLISKYYRKYGHTREQIEHARHLGKKIGMALHDGESLDALELKVPYND